MKNLSKIKQLTILLIVLCVFFFFRGSFTALGIVVLIGAMLLLLSKFSPSSFDRVFNGWILLGHSIGKLVNPVILSAIYFILLTPVALGMRLWGRDNLRMKRARLRSYWIYLEEERITPESFNNQF